MDDDLYPFVLFLPIDRKNQILKAIFGSKVALEIMNYTLLSGISNKFFQTDIIHSLTYSNKTIIKNLQSLTNQGILLESMEKVDRDGRTTWVKVYLLSNIGKWFTLLLAGEHSFSRETKATIFKTIFTEYMTWAKKLSETLHISKGVLKQIFEEALT